MIQKRFVKASFSFSTHEEEFIGLPAAVMQHKSERKGIKITGKRREKN